MSSAADRDARKPSNWKKCQKYKINWGVNEKMTNSWNKKLGVKNFPLFTKVYK